VLDVLDVVDVFDLGLCSASPFAQLLNRSVLQCAQLLNRAVDQLDVNAKASRLLLKDGLSTYLYHELGYW